MIFSPALRTAAAAILAFAAVAAHAEVPFSFAATPGKLPKDVVPVQYAAHLKPDLASNSFLGSENVEIDVLKPVSLIMLNAANLEIDSATLTDKGGAERKLAPQIDPARQTLSFHFMQPLAPGRYQLCLKFRGTINREARGLFQLPYKVGKADKAMIATNMEPSDARRLLPLWDEPSFRATFKLTVDLPSQFKAYSNTPIERQEKLGPGMQRVSFAVTPRMPSYLLVLVAGELERTALKQDGVEIGVVTTQGKQGSASYALGVSKRLLKYYNSYFGQPYPLAKLDQIAIPGGFDGAMENWGAIVYNESTLLVDPKSSPDSMREVSFSFNAHEVAHQWFGNLVTMAWWDNLWLNEGFASWMAAKAADHFHPEWRVQLSAQVERERVMELDARATTHAIQTPVETEEQAADAFDDITYIKGQAFLRMLEAYLGEEPFRKGMRAYMARHQYANTTSADLWAAMEAASRKPVARLADAWTTQPGFPLLGVTQTCDNGKRKVTLTQEQFRLDAPATEQRLWPVPVQLGLVNGKATYTLLSGASDTVLLPGCDGTLVIDPASVGYFRVQYDRASFDALAAQAPKLPDTTRLKLLTDAWSLVQAGRLELGSYLALVSRYAAEPRLAVWVALLDQLETLDGLAENTPESALVRRYLATLAAPKMRQLGWDDKPADLAEERQLRVTLAAALARAGDAAAIAEGRARFARFLKDPASISAGQLDFVTEVAGRHGDAAAYEALMARMLATESAEERERYSRALTHTRDPALAQRTLALALATGLPSNVTNRIVPGVAAGAHGDLAWSFAVANRDTLLRNQDAVSRNRLFPSLVAGSNDPQDAERMSAWVAANGGDDAQAEARSVANAIRTRAAQKERLLPQVRAALK